MSAASGAKCTASWCPPGLDESDETSLVQIRNVVKAGSDRSEEAPKQSSEELLQTLKQFASALTLEAGKQMAGGNTSTPDAKRPRKSSSNAPVKLTLEIGNQKKVVELSGPRSEELSSEPSADAVESTELPQKSEEVVASNNGKRPQEAHFSEKGVSQLTAKSSSREYKQWQMYKQWKKKHVPHEKPFWTGLVEGALHEGSEWRKLASNYMDTLAQPQAHVQLAKLNTQTQTVGSSTQVGAITENADLLATNQALEEIDNGQRQQAPSVYEKTSPSLAYDRQRQQAPSVYEKTSPSLAYDRYDASGSVLYSPHQVTTPLDGYNLAIDSHEMAQAQLLAASTQGAEAEYEQAKAKAEAAEQKAFDLNRAIGNI